METGAKIRARDDDGGKDGLTSPPLAWLTVQISKPSFVPRMRRECRRPSREDLAVITPVCVEEAFGAGVRYARTPIAETVQAVLSHSCARKQ